MPLYIDFNNIHTIAVVGLSTDSAKPSHAVAAYLQSHGFRIIPVNPNAQEILGEKAYPNIMSIPQDIHIDAVDIFRKSQDVLPIVMEAVKRDEIKIVWMQEGITNEDAYNMAKQKGLTVVMDRCMMKEHKKQMQIY